MSKELKNLNLSNKVGHYSYFTGDSQFEKDVNKLILDHWASTGRDMDILQACIIVLANRYNEKQTTKPTAGSEGVE